jgi:predicted TIM-barrel fold metal-dependent hydrolase
VSDYIRKHVKAGRLYVGCEGDEPGLPFACSQVGSEMFVYSSDFPHEVNNAMCKREIDELIESPDLTEADKANVLYANAQRFYGLAAPSSKEQPPAVAAR